MPAEILSYASLFTLAVGLIAGTVGGVVGTGSSIMLLPVLVWSFGPKQAVPIMAVLMSMATNPKVMGPHVIGRRVRWLGWAATALMGVTVLGMFVP